MQRSQRTSTSSPDLSLDKPVRVKIDDIGASSATLTQEFLRVRTGSKADSIAREATLVSICRRTFRGRTIVFFRSKLSAHKMKVIFGLCGMRAGELHGDLTQEQRLTALQRFREGKVDYLLATDLASRGLDIKGIEYVINYEMPATVEIYLHRVGRTARAEQAWSSAHLDWRIGPQGWLSRPSSMRPRKASSREWPMPKRSRA